LTIIFEKIITLKIMDTIFRNRQVLLIHWGKISENITLVTPAKIMAVNTIVMISVN
jgi:hypothetical protein